MSHPKIQHYVPRFLLSEFTKGNKKQFYVFDKQNEKSFISNVENVAAEREFYDIESDGSRYSIEEGLSDLEDKTSKIIKMIIRNESLAELTTESKVLLSVFLSIQTTRVRNFRDSLQTTYELLEDKLTRMGADLNNIKNFDIMTEEDIKELSISMVTKSAHNFSPHLLKKGWLLIRTTKEIPFIISDNPVTLDNSLQSEGRGNIGFAVEGVEVYMPISDTLCLYLICPSYVDKLMLYYKKFKRKDFIKKIFFQPRVQMDEEIRRIYHSIIKGSAYDIDKEGVVRQNSLQIINSSRFIFSPINDFKLVKDIIKKNPRYKKGPVPDIN